MAGKTYQVYLVSTGVTDKERLGASGKRGGEHDSKIVSPVRGTELEFYDSGVWLTREGGRNFFPYGQIRTIREHEGDGGGD